MTVRIFLLAVFGVAFANANAAEFTFSVSISDLGTIETTKTELSNGAPFIFPEDEFDTAEIIKPLIETFRRTRSFKAETEIEDVLSTLREGDTRVKVLVLGQEITGKDESYANFYDDYDKRVADLKQIFAMWIYHSDDISKAKLWNRRMQKEIYDTEENILRFPGCDISIPSLDTERVLKWEATVLPEFLRDGIGLDVSFRTHSASKMELNLPNFALTGMSAENTAKLIEHHLKTYTDLVSNFGRSGLYNIARIHLMEAMARHEIEAEWFSEKQSDDADLLLNSLGRYAFARQMSTLDTANSAASHHSKMQYFRPETKEIVTFAAGIEAIDLLKPDTWKKSDDLEKAAGYLLATAMRLGDGEEPPITSDEKWKLFRKLKPENLTSLPAFLKFAKTLYPNLDDDLGKAKSIAIETLRTKFPDGFPEKENLPELEVSTIISRQYVTSKFGELEVRHPDFLKDAVARLGPSWAKRSAAGRDRFQKAIEDRPFLEPQVMTERECQRFEDFGLDVPSVESSKNYAALTWKSSETDRLFYRIFPRKIDIWITKDLKKIMDSGVPVEGFAEENGNLTFYVGLESKELNKATIEEAKSLFSNLEAVTLPMVLDLDDVEGKSTEEQIKQFKESEIVNAIVGDDGDSVEKLKDVFAKRPIGITEEFCFFINVHEHAEVQIVRSVIGSPDRRWFADGMANYIAAILTNERFGGDAGWKVVEDQYRELPAEKKSEVLKRLKLFEWPAAGNSDGEADSDLTGLRYRYATYAIRKAVGDRNHKFIKEWLEDIRKARWIRTRSETIVESYDRLTDGDLQKIVETIGESGKRNDTVPVLKIRIRE